MIFLPTQWDHLLKPFPLKTKKRGLIAVLAAFLFLPGLIGTQTTFGANQGFQINRYEPTAPGELSIMVSHPWYSNTRNFSAGFTLNYAHNPLVFLTKNPMTGLYEKSDIIIANQLTGHINLAVAFWKINLGLSVPLTLFESGNSGYGVSPIQSVAVGDPRFSLLFQVYKDPQNSPFSISLGADLWIPLRRFTDQLPQQSSEQEFRVMPKIILAGTAVNRHILWSATAGYLWRPDSIVGNQGTIDGRSAGPELQIGGSIKYVDYKKRFAIGPEVMLRTTAMADRIFKADHTSLEVLLAGFYNVGGWVTLKAAAGMGVLTGPGTPDARVVFGIDVARMPKEVVETRVAPIDSDKDGIIDTIDKCPMEAQGDHPDPRSDFWGCPEKDTDKDGIYDSVDLCINEPQGDHPDPKRLGCPDKDSDNDGIYDSVDACPHEAGVPSTDPKMNGCPEQLISAEDGEIKILKPVLFDTNKSTIKEESFPVLESIANYLKGNPNVTKLRIEGHTDSDASASYNKKLSKNRVDAVKTWLIKKGVTADTLDTQGFGEECPIASNSTSEGKLKNRRVVFVVVNPPTPGITLIKGKCFQHKAAATFIAPIANSQQKSR